MEPVVKCQGQPRGSLWFNFYFCTLSIKYVLNSLKAKSIHFPTTEGIPDFLSLDDLWN